MEDIKEFKEYTNWPGRKSLEEEKEMVKMAIENQDEDAIKEYLTPLIQYWIKDFAKNHPQIKLADEEFLEAGFIHLNLGLRKYYKRVEAGEIGFKFSTYFEWFIRQGFLDYYHRRFNI